MNINSYDAERYQMGPPELWASWCNTWKDNPMLVQPDVVTCWWPGCSAPWVASYVDKNQLGHKFCAEHLTEFARHLAPGAEYCRYRKPHNWMLWGMNPGPLNQQNVPYCLPVGKCSFYPRGVSNYRTSDFTGKELDQVKFNHREKNYYTCGCNAKGYDIEKYFCCYAEIMSPEREAHQKELEATYTNRYKQISLFGGSDD